MPGYIMHLAVAEEFFRKARIEDPSWKNAFLLGSIVPDTLKGDAKRISHFWTDEMMKRLDRWPGVSQFCDKYQSRFKEPFVLGYYAHLLLDYQFMETFWNPEYFEFYDADKQINHAFPDVAYVYLKKQNQYIKREEFFSNLYYYGDYDKMNGSIMKRFQVTLPNMKICGVEENQLQVQVLDGEKQEPFIVSGIQEFDLGDVGQALEKMLDFATAIEEVKQETMDELRVFDFERMCKLIEDVAMKLQSNIK